MEKRVLYGIMSGGLLLILVGALIVILIFQEKKGDKTQETQVETLALAQEFDEDGNVEVDEAVIEDDQVEETKQEFDLSDHHFTLDISTDSLGISAPVFDGVTDSSLSRGVGRHVSTAVPNEQNGNVVLSGHQWYPGEAPGYTVFEDLDALSRDDEVSLDYGGKKYTYKIRETKVVEPSDVSILEQTDKPQLTLYTCYPRYSTEKRLVYIADLIGVESL